MGSLSKHTVTVGVVRLWIMVYTLVNVNYKVIGGGTTFIPWVITNEKLFCWGTIVIILGVNEKLAR